MTPKPSRVQTMSILVLINGIINILWGGLVALLTVILTVGVGLLCAPILILPMVLGVVEIIYALNLMADPPRVKEPSLVIAVLEICSILFGNIFGVVVGVISLIFINEEEVKDYFRELETPAG